MQFLYELVSAVLFVSFIALLAVMVVTRPGPTPAPEPKVEVHHPAYCFSTVRGMYFECRYIKWQGEA